jgi:hypothetical protein
MSDQNYRYEEETISLIDLVAVLVRFRRMIVGGTVAVAILVGVYLYGLPAFGVTERTEETYVTELRLAISPLSERVAEYVTLDVAGAVQSAVANPRAVGQAYRQVEAQINPEADPNRSRERYLSMIRRDVIDEALLVSYDRNTSVLTLEFSAANKEASREFLELLVEQIRTELTPLVLSQVSIAVDNIDTSLEAIRMTVVRAAEDAITQAGNGVDPDDLANHLESNADTALQSMADLVSLRERIAALGEEPGSLFAPLGEPVVYAEPSGGRATTAVIAVITAFFLLVFLAFVRQYIINVRNDEEEMKKLQEAWKGEQPPRE